MGPAGENEGQESSTDVLYGGGPLLWKCEDEIAPLLPLRFHADRAALLLDDLPGEVKSHAGAVRSLDRRGVTAVKTLEDVLDLSGRDADPLVSDLDHHIACKLSDADRDGGA